MSRGFALPDIMACPWLAGIACKYKYKYKSPSRKTPSTPVAIVSALEACDRCRCSQIGGIFHTGRPFKHLGGRLMWKVFCRKEKAAEDKFLAAATTY